MHYGFHSWTQFQNGTDGKRDKNLTSPFYKIGMEKYFRQKYLLILHESGNRPKRNSNNEKVCVRVGEREREKKKKN